MALSFEKAFGLSMKFFRKEKNFTQMELVRRSGLDRTTIPRYERGELSPSLRNVVKIAEALEIPAEVLVARTVTYWKAESTP